MTDEALTTEQLRERIANWFYVQPFSKRCWTIEISRRSEAFDMADTPAATMNETERAKMPSYELAKAAIREYATNLVHPVNAKVADLFDQHAPALAVWLSDRLTLSLLQQTTREVTAAELKEALCSRASVRWAHEHHHQIMTCAHDISAFMVEEFIILPRPVVSLVEGN